MTGDWKQASNFAGIGVFSPTHCPFNEVVSNAPHQAVESYTQAINGVAAAETDAGGANAVFEKHKILSNRSRARADAFAMPVEA